MQRRREAIAAGEPDVKKDLLGVLLEVNTIGTRSLPSLLYRPVPLMVRSLVYRGKGRPACNTHIRFDCRAARATPK